MTEPRKLSPEEHAWRAYCAIRCAKARLACLETVGHVQDDYVGDGAADGALECGRLVESAPSSVSEAAFMLGKAEAYLLGIRALNLIAAAPQVTWCDHDAVRCADRRSGRRGDQVEVLTRMFSSEHQAGRCSVPARFCIGSSCCSR